MEARINLTTNKIGGEVYKGLIRAEKALSGSNLPAATRELVKIRASQINGCGYCLDMHTKDAAHAGEDVQRLHLVAAWREATCFTSAERAALALTEQATRLADNSTGVSDDVWAAVREHYDEEQAAALVAQIALINTWNRINVALRNPAGSYTPGQWG
jgi:AhpD family alkylhydroperoxidase